MTVIVYDGRSCAVDSGAAAGTTMLRVRKFWTRTDELITGAGDTSHVVAMAEWYMSGAKLEEFPPMIHLKRDAELIVIDSNGVHRYEASPYAVDHGKDACAFGGGRDFAYGALAMGASAYRAAVIACQYSPVCAGPIHLFSWGGGGEVREVVHAAG